MNRNDFVAKTAEKTGLSKKDTDKALDGFIEVITDSLKSGEEIKITGFGKFETVKRAPRTGRNPATGQPLTVAGRVAPKFIAGKLLKDALN